MEISHSEMTVNNWRNFSDDTFSSFSAGLPVALNTSLGRATNSITAVAILTAALKRFAEQGYHGSSVREIAAAAGFSVPGVYHYYSSKQEILQELLTAGMNELLARSAAAINEAGASPQEQFDAVVEALLLFHMHRRDLAFVASTEIRSLSAEYRTQYIAQRDQQQRMVDEIIVRGVAEEEFGCEFPLDASRVVTSMCVAVSSWYRPSGPLTPAELVLRFQQIARDIVVGQ